MSGVIKSKLAQKIIDWQEDHGERLSLAKLAGLAGLTVNFLHRIRHDQWESMNRQKLAKLCAFFECTPNDLLWVPLVLELDPGNGESVPRTAFQEAMDAQVFSVPIAVVTSREVAGALQGIHGTGLPDSTE